MTTAHQLLHDLGLHPTSGAMFIADAYELPAEADTGEAPIARFTLSTVNTLWKVLHDLRGRVDGPVDLTWDGQRLLIAFTRLNGSRVRVQAHPLSPGQVALAKKLSFAFTGDKDSGRCAAEIPEEVAIIAAAIGTDARDTCGSVHAPEDPLGVLEFADHLERSGVCRWPERDRRLLTVLARDWVGSANELLSVASTLGLPRSP